MLYKAEVTSAVKAYDYVYCLTI